MAARAIWKGTLRIDEITCPIAMYAAATTSARVSLHLVNRSTGHRLKRVYVDEKTDKPVDPEDQVKGYEVSSGHYVMIEPEDVAAAVPDSDKVLDIEGFIACAGVEATYFDRPYYLLPGSDAATEPFELIREALRRKQVVAIAHTVLFRRVRPMLIRAHREGLIGTTLNFDYEVRSASEAFKSVAKKKIDPEMLDLAGHILKTKAGKFDPAKFDDRYENALAELVRAKVEGRKVVPLKRPQATRPNNLLEALRLSTEEAAGAKTTATAARRRKAG